VNSVNKGAALLLVVILTVSALIVAEAAPVSASIPKPSVPEFTVELEVFTGETSGWSNTQTLTIDTNSPQSPLISIMSPANTTYSAVYNPYITVPLTFATNTSLSWVGYSLDGGSNVTVTNGTLIEIPHESRSLTLYANDTAGNWAAPQTVYYDIAFNLGYPPAQPFPILLVVAISAAVVAVIGVGVLVYFKKRKHKA
jgi:hypothetical protein